MDIIIASEYQDPYKDAAYERKPDGVFLIDGKEAGFTMQCPHCGGHFLSVRGSGAKRSFCMGCNKVTCGQKRCVERCVPLERWLEAVEKRFSREYRLGL